LIAKFSTSSRRLLTSALRHEHPRGDCHSENPTLYPTYQSDTTGQVFLQIRMNPTSPDHFDRMHRPTAESPQCKRLATTLIVRPMMIAPKRNDTRACRSATLRIRLDTRSVSETWNVSPMVNAT